MRVCGLLLEWCPTQPYSYFPCVPHARAQVCEFVRLRIEELRKGAPPQAQNAAVLRTNAMKYLPHFFVKGQLEKLFFCFPDPHFKAKNHRRRIVSEVCRGWRGVCPSLLVRHGMVTFARSGLIRPTAFTRRFLNPSHTQRLLTEYAFFLQEGGLLYAITDGP